MGTRPAAAAIGRINADEALGIWVRERVAAQQPALEAMQAVLTADGLCACAGCAARALASAADTWLGGVGAALVMTAVLDRARDRAGDAAAGHRTPGGVVAVQVEHSLGLVDMAEVLARWVSARPPDDVVPPASREEAFEIVRDTLAFDGEQWDRWRDDLDAGHEVEDVVRAAYGWAAELFGPMFGDGERERLAGRLAMETAPPGNAEH
jgi:hypothetical protein